MSAKCKPGQQVELGRYETETGTRALVGRRIDGIVHIYDFAVDQPSRAYFVEAGFESKAELAALVADYLQQARLLGASPMGPTGLSQISAESGLATREPSRQREAATAVA